MKNNHELDYQKMFEDFERSCCNPYRNDAMRAYAASVGGFAECLKKSELDVKLETEMWTKTNPHVRSISGHHPWGTHIKNVIFNDPATIVFWSDGTKTVVKAQDDDWFDPEKGLAMAITKKALGNKGNYCNEFKKWLPKKESIFDDLPSFEEMADALHKVFKSLGE